MEPTPDERKRVGGNGASHDGPTNGSSLRLPDEMDVHKDHATPAGTGRPISDLVPRDPVVHASRQTAPNMPSMPTPYADEVRGPRVGTPRMPTPATYEPDEIRAARTGEPRASPLANPALGEVHPARQGPPTMPSYNVPPPSEVRAPRQGAPNMPTMQNPTLGDVHRPRTGPPSMPSLNVPPPSEVRAPRQGAPNMPTMRNPALGEVHSARQGPPTMPSYDVPPPSEVRAPRQGAPNMPTMQNPVLGEVRAPRQGPPSMPSLNVPDPDAVRRDQPRSTQKPSMPAPPSSYEVRKDHAVHLEMPALPTDPGEVQVSAEGMKAKKVRVMTTGVFDLIHLGHVHMLEAARKLGDELVVVVARDETVRKMKHDPLNGEEVRRRIVEELKPVTKAVLGHVGDIYRTVVDVRPDVIALGFDQKFTEDEVRKRSAEHGVGVRVVRLAQFDHDLDATRKIIERIGDRLAKKELYTQREG